MPAARPLEAARPADPTGHAPAPAGPSGGPTAGTAPAAGRSAVSRCRMSSWPGALNEAVTCDGPASASGSWHSALGPARPDPCARRTAPAPGLAAARRLSATRRTARAQTGSARPASGRFGSRYCFQVAGIVGEASWMKTCGLRHPRLACAGACRSGAAAGRPCGGCTARRRRRCSPSPSRRPWSAGSRGRRSGSCARRSTGTSSRRGRTPRGG